MPGAHENIPTTTETHRVLPTTSNIKQRQQQCVTNSISTRCECIFQRKTYLVFVSGENICNRKSYQILNMIHVTFIQNSFGLFEPESSLQPLDPSNLRVGGAWCKTDINWRNEKRSGKIPAEILIGFARSGHTGSKSGAQYHTWIYLIQEALNYPKCEFLASLFH